MERNWLWAHERRKALAIVNQIKDERNGRASSRIIDGDEDDAVFWDMLGGKGTVAAAIPDVEVKRHPPALYHLSDATGSLVVEEVEAKKSSLESDDVFILSGGKPMRFFIWVGSGASKGERTSAMPNAVKILEQKGLPTFTPVTRVLEGQETKSFNKLLK